METGPDSGNNTPIGLTCTIVEAQGDPPRWRVMRSDGMQITEESWPCIADDPQPSYRPMDFYSRADAERVVMLYVSGVPVNSMGLTDGAPSGVHTAVWAAPSP